jgi:hypothetical protein
VIKCWFFIVIYLLPEYLCSARQVFYCQLTNDALMKKLFTFNLKKSTRFLGFIFLLLLCTDAFSQTICRPVSQTNSEGGILCVGLNVDSPENAYDNLGLSTFATLTNAVGVGCFVEETLTLNQTLQAGDQILIYLGTGSGLLDVGLLSNVSLQAKLSGVNVGSRTALNSPLLNLSLLAGINIGYVTYTVTAPTNQIQIQVGGLLSLLVNLRLYDVRLQFAAPAITGGTSQTICSGTAATLIAVPQSGTTVAWYDSATSTAALATTNTFTTPVLTATTTYYIGVSRANGCESNQRIPVVLTVANPVAPAISSTGTSICSAGATQQTTLSVVNPIPGTTYNWYDVASGGTSLASGTSYSPTVSVGTTTFYVEAVIGSCVSSGRTQVNVVSNAVPAVPTALTQSVTIQSGQNAALNATAPAGVTLNWYDVPTGGTALATHTTSYTTSILTTTKTYYVEAQSAVGNCTSSSRTPIIVTVATSSLGGCLEANSQQTTQNGLCLLCSSTNPDFSVDGNPATAARLTIPVGLINGWVQQTLQFANPGKAGDIVDVELELPGGLADVALLGAVSLATYNGATYNNDRILINNALVNLQLLSGDRFRASITAGAAFNRVEIRLSGLATVLTSLDIYQASYRYKAPAITGNTVICSGQTTTLTAGLSVGETINWFDVPTGGTSLASTASFTTPALTGNTTYYAEITRNGCVYSGRFPVLLTVSNPVVPVIASTGTTICSGQSTALDVQSPVGGTVYRWYDAASAGNLLFTGSSFTTPNLTSNTNYFVEAAIGSCTTPTRTSVTVNINPRPSVPVPVAGNVVIESGQALTLSVTSTAGITYDWYDSATGGVLLSSGSVTYTPALNLTSNTIFYVEARNSATGCTSNSRTPINVTVTGAVSNCLRPTSQEIVKDPGLLCVLCVSNNETASFDGNINTFASLIIPAGVLNAYIQQQLTFGTPGEAGDIIDLYLELPGGLLDLSLLGSVSVATYNGVTFNNDRLFLNNSLLNLQLLSGNKFKVSFQTANAFDKVEIRLGALVGLLTTLNIYEVSYRFPNASVTGASAPICAGSSASLVASAGGTETFTWYDAPTGGNIVSVNPTAPLTTSATYYLESNRGGCINSVRQPVAVEVLSFPTAADISITSPITASCGGEAVLAPASTLPGAIFKYYTDQNKTVEITNGSVIAGITFLIDPLSGELTVSGMPANSSYTLFVSVLNGGTCENQNGTLKEVIINNPPQSALTIQSPILGCAVANLRDAITNYDDSGNTTYRFFDALNNQITEEAAGNVTATGLYFIEAHNSAGECPSTRLPVSVIINPLPTLTVIPSVSVNAGDSVSLDATSDGVLTWFDPQGNALTPPYTTGVLNTPGIYSYTVVATNANCSTTATVSINVMDTTNCQLLTERVYASGQSSGSIITGGVANGANAIDGDPQTYSTIVTGLGVAGVGTTWQNLTWPTTIPKGTPVTIKLGAEYSGLAVAQGLSVVGTKNGIDIGTIRTIDGSLLDLLPGEKSYEYTFVPSNIAGPQDYDGIRVISGAVLSVAQNTRVYEAYYTRQVTTLFCTPGDVEDVFYGASDLGLPVGALTSTVGVSDAWNVADNDITTYTTMYNGIGLLAAADLTVEFKTPSIASDTLRIVVSKPGVLLDVNLLTGFSIQRYMGNVPVGAPIQNTSTLLGLRVLPGNTLSMVLLSAQPEPYDRVRIRLGGVAGVLDLLRIHSVDRVANSQVIGGDADNKITVCAGADVTLATPPDACSDYIWYDSPTGGTVVANGVTFTIPETLTEGIYKYFIQPVRYGCEAFSRGEVTIEVRSSSPENALTNITLNGGTSTSVCSPTGIVTLNTRNNKSTCCKRINSRHLYLFCWS